MPQLALPLERYLVGPSLDVIGEKVLHNHLQNGKNGYCQNKTYNTCQLSTNKERKNNGQRMQMQRIAPTTCGEITLLSSTWHSVFTMTTSRTILTGYG